MIGSTKCNPKENCLRKIKLDREADKPKFLGCAELPIAGLSPLPPSRKCQADLVGRDPWRGHLRGAGLKGAISVCARESPSIFAASQVKGDALLIHGTLLNDPSSLPTRERIRERLCPLGGEETGKEMSRTVPGSLTTAFPLWCLITGKRKKKVIEPKEDRKRKERKRKRRKEMEREERKEEATSCGKSLG